MRTEYRPAWSMTTILLITLFCCFILQKIGDSVDPGFVNNYLALSKDGLLHWRVYQLLTFQFLHGGWLHLLGNMVGLYFFGRAMEETLGRKGLLTLYLLCGSIGGIFQMVAAFAFPTKFGGAVVGASAGIFGLIAAFATRAPDQPITMLLALIFPITFQARVLLIIEAVLAILGLISPWLPVMGPPGNIAYAAHLGGMVTGIFFIRWLGSTPRTFQFWRPFARRQPPPKRELVRATPRRVWRNVRKPVEDVPTGDFISREVDPILEKISAHGIQSLTERERQVLEAARNKMAKR